MMWDKNGMLSKGRHMTLIIAMLFVLSVFCPLIPGDRYVFAEAQIIAFKDVSVNDYHACVVDTDGDLYTFGNNGYGLLGHGKTGDSQGARKVLENVRSVKAAYYNTAAITEDDALWICGINFLWPDSEIDQHLQTDEYAIDDDTGIVSIIKPVKVMTGVKSAAVAAMFMAFIDQDDSLWLWGSDASSLLHAEEPVKVMDDVKEVSLGGWGGSSACIGAVKEDGTLWTWGVNEHGNLGITSDEDQSSPVKMMDDVVSVSMGDGLCGAVKEDGSLWTWGESDPSGEMPSKYMDGVKCISFERGMAGAVQNDGSLWTWGDNVYGGLGDGTMDNRTDPVKILDNVETVSMGLASAAIDSENTFWFWGNVYFQQYWGDGAEDRKLTPERFAIGSNDEEEEEEEFIRGDVIFNYEKSYDKTEDGETSVYYDNDFFDSDNTKYNHKLATASLGLAMAGMHKEHVKGFLKNSGFSHNMEFSDRFDLPRTDDQDKVAYTFATKEISGTTVIAVVLRGGDYGNEWGSNGRVGHLTKTYGYHYGFSKAAEDVILNLESYCNQNGINLKSSKVWLTGYSRSAAVSNCVGMMLERDGLIKKENLYCYTFATPRTVTEENVYKSAQGIYNIVNPVDIVTCVPLNSSTTVGAGTHAISLGKEKV